MKIKRSYLRGEIQTLSSAAKSFLSVCACVHVCVPGPWTRPLLPKRVDSCLLLSAAACAVAIAAADALLSQVQATSLSASAFASSSVPVHA